MTANPGWVEGAKGLSGLQLTVSVVHMPLM